MLHGLHALHSATDEDGALLDLVHRDVSPQNLLICADGMSRVLDFGIAKAKGRIHETRTGIVRGKAAYMAPEQLRAERVDQRADIYAASVVLWEALAGRMLFDDDSPAPARSLKSIRGPSDFGAMVPSSLERIILRGLEQEPEQRWPTAREMALAIEGALPLPSHALVGEWLERAEGAALAEQRRRLQQVESHLRRGDAAEVISPVPTPARSPVRPSLHASTPVDPVEPSAQLTRPEPPAAPAPRSLRAMLIAGGIYWLIVALGGATMALFGVIAVLEAGLKADDSGYSWPSA